MNPVLGEPVPFLFHRCQFPSFETWWEVCDHGRSLRIAVSSGVGGHFLRGDENSLRDHFFSTFFCVGILRLCSLKLPRY